MSSLINDGIGMTLGYDVTGRLVQTTRTPSSTTQAYNALGRRVRKTTTGTGAGSVLYAYDEEGRLLGAYRMDSGAPGGFITEEEQLFLDGWRLVAAVRPDVSLGMSAPIIYPVLSDHLGTPRKVLDPVTGFTRWDWDAKEPFGMQAPNNDPSGAGVFVLDARFPGQRFDRETGLHHNGFRDYHAGLGRYVQSDPLGLEAGWNTYAYVGSYPTGSIDPLGLDDLIVVIWTRMEGHVVTAKPDGSILSSSYPFNVFPERLFPAQLTKTWTQTLKSAGTPTAIYKIRVDRESPYELVADMLRHMPSWEFVADSNSTNCAASAQNILNAGGFKVSASPAYFPFLKLPGVLKRNLDQMIQNGDNRIEQIHSVPWQK